MSKSKKFGLSESTKNLLLNKGINLNIYDMLLRKAVSPMHLMSVDVVMKELEEV